MYTPSPAAYKALRNFGILNLPCANSLWQFTGFNLETAGIHEERITHARTLYDSMVAEKKKQSQSVPLSEGVLIFDEVKVGVKVHYHAKTGTLLGLSMSSDDLGSLHDVYQTLNPHHRVEHATYVLQYLWRDLSSDFDVIGPYFPTTQGNAYKTIYLHFNYTEDVSHTCRHEC